MGSVEPTENELLHILSWLNTVDFEVWVDELLKTNMMINMEEKNTSFELDTPQSESTRIDDISEEYYDFEYDPNRELSSKMCSISHHHCLEVKIPSQQRPYQTGYANDPIIID